MGSSSSNTGIAVVDNAVDTAVNNVVTPVAKNAEKNLQNAAGGIKEIATGNFNNLGRTLTDVALAGTGYGLAINPNDIRSIAGETSIERRSRETAERQASIDAQASAAEAAQSAEDKKRPFVEDITARARLRRRTPGMGQSLLGESTGPNTLLTTSERAR